VTADDVLAVVVSYNGEAGTGETVRALRAVVPQVHVVDNGSAASSLAVLAELEREPGVTIERLGQNRGLAHALNRGVEQARARSRRWLLTMDQDSLVDRGMIDAYIAAVASDASLVSLAPVIGSATRKEESGGGTVGYAITSGNLVRVDLFDSVGTFAEELFIDCVDFDFSLRVRRAGYRIVRVAGASMEHRLGEQVRVPDFLKAFYARHSPRRRYYMYRNFLYLAERHGRWFPWFILRLGLLQLMMLPLILLYDRHPLASIRAIVKGAGDYLRRRTGPYLEPAP
jgi:rhamnosyltransferase